MKCSNATSDMLGHGRISSNWAQTVLISLINHFSAILLSTSKISLDKLFWTFKYFIILLYMSF